MAVGEPTATGEGTIRELMWAERPAGTHLGPSSDADGLSPLARDDDSNAISTHVRLHAYDPDATDDADGSGGLDARSLAVGAVAAVGVALIVRELAPHARRLWTQHAMPVLRSTRGALTGSRGSEAAEPAPVVPAEVSTEVVTVAPVTDELAEDDRVMMSSAEARERLAAALLTRAFSDEQLRLLAGARIVDGLDPADAERALSSLTPEQLEAGSKLLLESGSLEELRHLLGLDCPAVAPVPGRLTARRA